MNMHTRPSVTIARIALLAGVSLWPAAGFAQDAANSPPATKPLDASQATSVLDPGLQADLALLERLDQPFAEPVPFDDAPVGEVLKRIAKETGVRILPDRLVLEEGGGWTLKTVTCVAATPRIALDAAVRSIGEGLGSVRLDVASGVVVLTDSSGLRALRTTCTYDAEDLLRAYSQVGSGSADSVVDEPFKPLLDALASAVEPESWVLNGGDLLSAATAGSGLTVYTTPAFHQKVARALVTLCETSPTDPILWTITLRELPADIDRATEQDLVASAAAGAGAGVGAQENEVPNEEVRNPKVPGVVRSQPKILARPTEPASISLGSESETWSFEIRPSCADGRCTYSLDVALTLKSETVTTESRIALSTSVKAPTAVVFSAGEGKTAKRFLVHVVGTRQSPAKPE